MRTFLLSILILTLPSGVHAAVLGVSGAETIPTSGITPIAVTLATEGENVNAIEGTMNIPSELVVDDIRYTGSIVPLWLEEPYINEEGNVRFAGVFPGGYQNGGLEAAITGNLFTLYVRGVNEGRALVAFDSATTLYANDGEGTPITPTRSSVSFAVVAGAPAFVAPEDTRPPEVPVIGAVDGEFLNQGGRVLVFASHDKDSGIARYDIARSFFPLPHELQVFTPAESPEPLHALDAIRMITIRATDHAGNSATATYLPGGVAGYAPTALVVILIMVALVLRKWARSRYH